MHTCYSPVRHSPAGRSKLLPPLPSDLHVLSLQLAFILSQDQTLRCLIYCYIFLLCCCRSVDVSLLRMLTETICFLVSCVKASCETSAACPVAECHCSFAIGTLPVSFLTSGRFPIADAKLVQKSGVVKHLVQSPYIFTDFYVLKHCFSA